MRNTNMKTKAILMSHLSQCLVKHQAMKSSGRVRAFFLYTIRRWVASFTLPSLFALGIFSLFLTNYKGSGWILQRYELCGLSFPAGNRTPFSRKPNTYPYHYTELSLTLIITSRKLAGRSKWPRGFRPLKHWDRGFESRLRLGCLWAFVLFVLFCVQVAALRRAEPQSKESYWL
jgi:hypothetical protein